MFEYHNDMDVETPWFIGRYSRGPFRLSVALILKKYLMFKGLDPKINIPHRKTNFSEKHTSIDISFENMAQP